MGVHSEPESAAVSRERRRVALAASVIVAELQNLYAEKLEALETKLDRVISGLALALASQHVYFGKNDEILQASLIAKDDTQFFYIGDSLGDEKINLTPDKEDDELLNEHVLLADAKAEAAEAPEEVVEGDPCRETSSDAIQVIGEWRSLPSAQWQHVHSKFMSYRLAMATCVDEATRAKWDANPVYLPIGTKIEVRCGIYTSAGTILRRGYGTYASQCRVVFDSDGRDRWVECGLCTALT